MIDWNKTEKKFGYTKGQLPKTSTKKVVWHCDNDNCQAPHDVREREYAYAYAYKKQIKAKKNNSPELCQKCSHLPRKGKVSKKKKNSAMPLPSQINVEKTRELTGLDPRDMKPWSRERLILTCDCGKDCSTTRAQINNYKSIKQTGDFKCTACWTKERRKGIKVSKDTKEMMSNSQKMRRSREKSENEKRAKEFLDLMNKERKRREDLINSN